jgi:serine/threonine protein kinase
MTLQYPPDWNLEGIGFTVPTEAVENLLAVLRHIAGGSWDLIEQFKTCFGRSGRSTSFDYAVGDLRTAMQSKAENAPQFVDALWSSIQTARAAGKGALSVEALNRHLERHRIPLRVDPPHMRTASADNVIVDSPTESVDVSSELMSFSLGHLIGSGGFGRVYRATRTTSVGTFDYAVKVLDPSPFVTDTEKARLRFQREIRLLQSLQHRAIVTLIDAGMSQGHGAFLVMPLIVGADLRTACSKFNLLQILDAFIEVLGGLQAAHAAGVIHRDLKPTNIIVRTADRQPIIVDFGAAYQMDDLDAAGLTSHAVGTLGYIPSEVAADPKQRSALQDIYACGVMLYEVFAGRLPDPLNYAPLSAIRIELRPLDTIVRAAISGVATRTRSALDFASQLSAIRREGQARDGTGALAQGSQIPIASLSTADVPQTLFDGRIGIAWVGSEAALDIRLTNISSEVLLENVVVQAIGLHRWNDVRNEFETMPEIDGSAGRFLPVTLHTAQLVLNDRAYLPSQEAYFLYQEAPLVFLYLSLHDGTLEFSGQRGSSVGHHTIRTAGTWRVSLRVAAGQSSEYDRIQGARLADSVVQFMYFRWDGATAPVPTDRPAKRYAA